MKYFINKIAPVFLLLTLLFFGLSCDDFLSDFQDEDYKMNPTDEQAATLHTANNFFEISAADFETWIYNHIHYDTLASVLTDYTGMRFDTSQVVSGTDTVDVIDTLYQFTFDTTITVHDVIEFDLSHGEMVTMTYDTSYVFTANVEGSDVTYDFLKINTLTKTYTLSDYYIITTSEIDTLPKIAYTDILDSLSIDSVFIHEDTSAVYGITITKTPVDNYICLEIPVSEEVVFLYTEYVDMALLDETMQEVPCASNNMPLETYSLYSYFDTKEQKVLPYFKERFSYKLTGTRYFLRIDATEYTAKTSFELAIIYK